MKFRVVKDARVKGMGLFLWGQGKLLRSGVWRGQCVELWGWSLHGVGYPRCWRCQSCGKFAKESCRQGMEPAKEHGNRKSIETPPDAQSNAKDRKIIFLVCAHVCVSAHMCAVHMHMEARGYGVISQEPFTLFVETGSPEPHCLARLIDQEALGPCLSLHPPGWGYRGSQPHSFSMGAGIELRFSGSHVYVTSTLHGSARFPCPWKWCFSTLGTRQKRTTVPGRCEENLRSPQLIGLKGFSGSNEERWIQAEAWSLPDLGRCCDDSPGRWWPLEFVMQSFMSRECALSSFMWAWHKLESLQKRKPQLGKRLYNSCLNLHNAVTF